MSLDWFLQSNIHMWWRCARWGDWRGHTMTVIKHDDVTQGPYEDCFWENSRVCCSRAICRWISTAGDDNSIRKGGRGFPEPNASITTPVTLHFFNLAPAWAASPFQLNLSGKCLLVWIRIYIFSCYVCLYKWQLLKGELSLILPPHF